jgi:hypothetical protein
MRIAFLVLNHRPPEQLVRLLTTLRSQLPDSPIVVHHDIFHGEFPRELIESIDNVHLVASGKRIVWGDFGQVEVCLWALTWMREHLDFDWMVLLSGQDYPIKPLGGLPDELTAIGADAVFRATPISQLSIGRHMLMRRRYLFQYRSIRGTNGLRWLPRGVRDAFRRATRPVIVALNMLQPLFKIYLLPDRKPYRFGWRARKRPFNRNWPCWHASSWFQLSRGALEYVLDYVDDHPEYVDYCSRTMNADESMLATLVFNSQELRVANRDTTYTRWSNPWSPHPDIFRSTDLAQLTAVAPFFARKFDIAVDADILDQLDEFIGIPVDDRE